MDYVESLETIIPGTQGRVLGVLARTDSEMTMRRVAQLAGISPNRAVAVLRRLVSLGVVERREAGAAALVRLRSENEAARILRKLADLHESVLERLRLEAADIEPSPASLVVFGSFATGQARVGSDVDVLALPPPGVPADDPRWVDSLGRWCDRAARISGNPVNPVVASAEELPELLGRPGSVWQAARRDGVLLLGRDLGDLGKAR